MGESPVRDTLVGLFVLAGIAAVGYLSVTLGGATYRGGGGLKLYAGFDEVGGLKPRAQVVVGGVKVGQVTGISLNDHLRARVELDVRGDLELPVDTSAEIRTAGVLGDQYIALEPGGDDRMLASGDTIQYTQNALVLERLIGRLVQNLGSEAE